MHTHVLAFDIKTLLDDFLSLQNLQITPTHAVQSSPKNNNNIKRTGQNESSLLYQQSIIMNIL